MAKIIRLTESDLRRIVKKVIKEQKSFISEGDGGQRSPFLDHEIQPDVDTIVDDLDGWVDGSNLDSIYSIIMKYNNKFASDYTNPNKPVTVPALIRLMDLYKMDENGDDLFTDLNQVGTRTLPNAAITKKQQVLNVLLPFTKMGRSPQQKGFGGATDGSITPGQGGTRPTTGGAQSSTSRPTTAQSSTSRMPVR